MFIRDDNRSMNMRLNPLKKWIRRYQTRQQLQRLPAHLLQDIGKDQLHVDAELRKNNLLRIIITAIQQRQKGS